MAHFLLIWCVYMTMIFSVGMLCSVLRSVLQLAKAELIMNQKQIYFAQKADLCCGQID